MQSDLNLGLPSGSVIERVPNQGSVGGEGWVITANGGNALAGWRQGGGGTARLPQFGAERAVITFGDRPMWSPKNQPFEFGIDVRMYPSALNTNATDDGNNILQRGLWTSETAHQYKIDADPRNGRLIPGCRIRGSARAGVVRLETALEPGQWYRLRCRRTADGRMVHALRRYDGGAWRLVERRQTSVDVGSVDPVGHLTIGGKVRSDGTIATESDQLNGIVDNPFLRIGDL